MNTTLSPYLNDRSQYFLEGEALKFFPSIKEVPRDFDLDKAVTIGEAVRHLQRLGCCGLTAHNRTKARGEFDALCLAVVRYAVAMYGETVPIVYRGTRSDRPLAEYKVLFGATSEAVAEFYGSVQILQNVQGLRTLSTAESVVTQDYSIQDEEIIFFP